jgi:hypothetical protein
MEFVAVAFHAMQPTEATKPEGSFHSPAYRDGVVVQNETLGGMFRSVATLRDLVTVPTFFRFPLAVHGIHLFFCRSGFVSVCWRILYI